MGVAVIASLAKRAWGDRGNGFKLFVSHLWTEKDEVCTELAMFYLDDETLCRSEPLRYVLVNACNFSLLDVAHKLCNRLFTMSSTCM